MTEQEVMDLVETANGTTSTYDNTLHCPIPTLAFVKSAIGIDMNEFCGNETRAKIDLKKYSNLAKKIWLGSKKLNTANLFEYKIATNSLYREEFIVYVAYFIDDIISNGLMANLEKIVNSSDLTANLTFQSFALVKSGLLSIGEFTCEEYDYRVGY